MYKIYKYHETKNKSSYYTNHLNILRLDKTENELFERRFIDTDYDIESKRPYNSPLKKIGFISDDFRESRPSGQLSIAFFEKLQNYRPHFEIYFYTRERLSKRFQEFAVIRQYNNRMRIRPNEINKKLKEMILEDDIDILFDMQGHMHNNYNNILNEKLAPIMCHWLGYPGTMGIPTFDYIFADPTIIPEESQIFYREKIAYFPICYQPNNPEFLVNETYTRKEFDIPEDKFVFCHFNSDYKMDRKMWLVMLDILKRTPNAILMFKTSRQDFEWRLFDDAEKYGVNKNQLLHVKRLFITEHIKRLSVSGLGLDNFRLNGHTTSSDCIAGGIPFITYTGNTYHNRVAKSILHSLSLDELCTNSYDEYIDLAVKLATNKEYYNSVVKKLKENREKVLFNNEEYVNHFVSLMHNIWKRNYNENIEYIWVFYTNYDSPGNDIVTTDKRDNNLLEMVKDTPDCIAYTTNGHLKNKITDKKDWVKLENVEEKNVKDGLWVKEKLKEYEITKFGNNHKENRYKWTFFKDVDSKDFDIKQVDEKNQLLRDIAEQDESCVAFNLKGYLKSSLKPKEEWVEDIGNGLWIREKVEFEDIKLDNKDYNLPFIVLYYNVSTFVEYEDVKKIFDKDLYLNKQLILLFVGEEDFQHLRISQRVNELYDMHLVRPENKKIEEIIKETTPDCDCYMEYKKNENIQYIYDNNKTQFFKNNLTGNN
tara:strand:+ start:3819 stop:5939 length:2121 start_codon:yes stop_codon:yes gene_type:complete